MAELQVNLVKQIDDSYPIYIGSGIFEDRIQKAIKNINPTRIVLITDSKVYGIYCDILGDLFTKLGWNSDNFMIAHFEAGEENKNIDTIMQLFSWLATHKMDRKSLVIAYGGGVSGDMAGFLAAIYMRGIPFVQVPTSLLAMVDSSVGGKTGVDTSEGKNLIGCFHQPKAVIIDIDFLETLLPDEFINGMAEVIKHSIIYDRKYFDFIVTNLEKIRSNNKDVLIEMIRRSCEIKAYVVENDEKEGGLRKILNYGHTIGHAIENASDYAIPHGYAVALGMLIEASLSAKQGILSGEDVAKIGQLLMKIGLLKYHDEAKSLNINMILKSLLMDKKNQSGEIHCVMIKQIGEVVSEGGKYSYAVDEKDIKELLQRA